MSGAPQRMKQQRLQAPVQPDRNPNTTCLGGAQPSSGAVSRGQRPGFAPPRPLRGPGLLGVCPQPVDSLGPWQRFAHGRLTQLSREWANDPGVALAPAPTAPGRLGSSGPRGLRAELMPNPGVSERDRRTVFCQKQGSMLALTAVVRRCLHFDHSRPPRRSFPGGPVVKATLQCRTGSILKIGERPETAEQLNLRTTNGESVRHHKKTSVSPVRPHGPRPRPYSHTDSLSSLEEEKKTSGRALQSQQTCMSMPSPPQLKLLPPGFIGRLPDPCGCADPDSPWPGEQSGPQIKLPAGSGWGGWGGGGPGARTRQGGSRRASSSASL